VSSGGTSIYPQGDINSHNSLPKRIYEFDRFRLDAAHRMLYEDNQPMALAPKVVETLIALAERHGEIVSKDELVNRVWAGSVVEESNLTQNIYLLRKALGDATDGRPFIESFRRRGYRFNGEVRAREEIPIVKEGIITERSPNEVRTATAEAEGIARPASDRMRKLFFVACAIAVCGLLLGVGFITNSFLKAKSRNSLGAPLKITRLTPDLNIAGTAAFTPDGNHFAYVLIEKGQRSVWLKDLASGAATQVLPPIPIVNEEGYGFPQFSSDGHTIFYVSRRKEAPNGTIVRLALSSGAEQRISVDVISPFALSPDEKQIAFINSRGQLLVAQTDGSGERVLAERDGKKAWFVGWSSILCWSPDGERIAVCGSELDTRGKSKGELLDVSTRDGSIKRIPIPDWDSVDDAIWLRDQTALVVVARETATSPFQVWKVAYPSGEATRVTNDTNSYDGIALSPDSRRLVATQIFQNTNIWTAPTDAPARAKQLTFGSAAADGFYGIAFAADGKIIYTSPRDGHIDLWEMNPDGTEQRQLTRNVGDYNDRPNVTPNGRFVVFRSSRSGGDQIWRMEADGANPQQLTHAEIGAREPAVSPDGQWVYFTLEGEVNSIWKIPLGGGELIRVSPTSKEWSGPWNPALSPNGKLISFALYDAAALQPWKIGVMRAIDGAPLKTFDTACYRLFTQWTSDSRALYCMKDEATNLWQLPIDGGHARRLTNFESGRIFHFALSPDHKRLAVARGNPSSEVVLLENF
jgi:Tol biopolymer transport system component/DNA-binding winged helix-turn-helix (wHTH) protein